MKDYKLYLLDFDGTLINSYEGLYYFYNEVFNQYGFYISKEQTYQFSKISLQAAFDLTIKDPNKIEDFKAKCYEVINTGMLIKYNKPYKDALALISYLNKKHIPVGIVTGNGESHVKMVFDKLGLSSFYQVLICGDKIKEQKPHPYGILKAIEEFKYQGDYKDICYIGDAYNDFLAAKNAKITPILVDRFNEYELSDEYIRINNLEELIK